MFKKGIISQQQKPYIFTVKTDNSGTSNNDQFTFPLVSGGTYNFTAYSSDGTVFSSNDYTNNTMTFDGGAGTYTVKVYGTLKGWKFANSGDRFKFLNISQWGIFNHGNENNTFKGCGLLTVTATDLIDLTGITSFYGFFGNCQSIVTVPRLGEWVTSAITDIRDMFKFDSSFNDPGVSQWDTSGIQDMRAALQAENFNQDISGWNFESLNATNRLDDFMLDNTAFSTENYNALLLALDSQTLFSGMSPNFGDATYSMEAATAYYNLVTDDSMTITDGGLEIAGYRAWYDMADTSTITESSNLVSAVADKFLNSEDVSQATTKPLTNTDTINSLNALTFDGTDDYLAKSGFTAAADTTIFIVFKPISSDSDNDSILSMNATNDFQIDARTSGEYKGRFNSSNLGDTDKPLLTDQLGNVILTTYRLSSGDSEIAIRLNGTESSTDTYNGALDTTQNLKLGGNRAGTANLECLLGEVLIFNDDLSASDIAKVETYLNNKWSIY